VLANLQPIIQKDVMDDDSFDDSYRFRLHKRHKRVFKEIARRLGMDLATWMRVSLIKEADAHFQAQSKPSPFVDDNEGATDANAKSVEPKASSGKRPRSET
jgi:hypothetical protein